MSIEKTFICVGLLSILIICTVSQCQEGTYQDSNNQCQQCDISCATCSSIIGCSTCYDQMYLAPVGNKVLCQLCYTVNVGCSICTSANKCSECSNGYYLQQDNTCVNCGKLIPNCLLCDVGNLTGCMSCSSNYQLINGTCVNTNANQSTIKSSVVTANNSQSQTSGIITVTSVQNSNNGSTTSNTCDSSQVNLNGVCFLAIAFCLQYNPSNGQCTSCTINFILQNGYCLPSSLITATATATTTINSNPATPAPTQNPITSNVNVSCTDRQYLSNGVCMNIGSECILFDSITGSCYKCSQGYQIYNGLCVQLPQNDNLASNIQNCTSPCLSCQPQNSTYCLSCINGFTTVDLIPGQCFKM